MAHFERGVYEPGEDIRVFDGSEDDEDVEGSRLPLLIVLALLVLAMFGGVVWLAYTQGVARGRTETPVLTAQNGPARTAPANPGGAEQPYKGFKIYEQPAPPDDDSAAATTTAANPALKPATVAATPAPPMAAKPAPPAAAPKVAAAIPAPAPKIVAAPPAQAPKQAAPPAAAPKVAAAPPKPAPPKAAPPPATPAGPATAAPRPLASAAPSTPAPKPAAAAPAAAAGAFALQIGSYPNQADAEAAWKSFKAKHSALLADAAYEVKQADLGSKGVWYRLRLVGYPSKDVASAMCDRLKSDGGACIPAQ